MRQDTSTFCIVLMHCVIRYCYDDTTEFWQQWQAELAGVAREIAAARPEFGVDILSCPFHGAVNWAWDYLEVATQHNTMLQLQSQYLIVQVPVLDGDTEGEKMVVRDIIANFMRQQHPYQAVDEVAMRNPTCPWQYYFFRPN